MERLTFLVNRGENDCFMAHGLDWAAYAEATSWSILTRIIKEDVQKVFADCDHPVMLDFKFPDGTVVSLCA